MIAAIFDWFSSSGLMPRGHCYQWRPEIVGTHVVSDLIIALSYWSISIGLFYVMRKRLEAPVRRMVGLFATFICVCGVIHVMEIVTVWSPVYVASGLIKALAAVVSVVTATVFVPLLPRIVSFRSPAELEALNQERLEVEQRLRRSHALQAAIVNTAPLSVIVLDQDGNVTLWNPAAERMFGWTASEVLGQAPPHVMPHDHSAGQTSATPTLAGKTFQDFETRRQTKTGGFLDVALWTAPLTVDGQVIGSMHLLSDITERKHLDQQGQQSNAQLEQHVAARTAELEHANRELIERDSENEMFVYSVSHDLRSPLVNLQGFSQELQASSNELRELLEHAQLPETVRKQGLGLIDGDIHEAVHYIQTAATNLSNILNALLRLSRVRRAEYSWQQVDMERLLHGVAAAQAADIRNSQADIRITALSPAWGDAGALDQVFAQILSNALRYTPPNMPPRVEIGELPQPGTENRTSSDSRYQTYYVRDCGLGISEALHSKVFQPFQRLHPQVAPGEGIGLALARRIVERHGGRIWFESQADAGATFYISLPIHANNGQRERT